MTESIDVGLPEKLEFCDRGTHIEIIRKWFGVKTVVYTLVAIFWNGFLCFWYIDAAKMGALIAFFLPIFHVAMGVWLIYLSIASWFNRTIITASPSKISIRHRPIPWMGNIDMNAFNLKQLYTKEIVSRTRNGTSLTYSVRIITNDGRNKELIADLESIEQALFIEQKIEKYLNITDVPVKGSN